MLLPVLSGVKSDVPIEECIALISRLGPRDALPMELVDQCLAKLESRSLAAMLKRLAQSNQYQRVKEVSQQGFVQVLAVGDACCAGQSAMLKGLLQSNQYHRVKEVSQQRVVQVLVVGNCNWEGALREQLQYSRCGPKLAAVLDTSVG